MSLSNKFSWDLKHNLDDIAGLYEWKVERRIARATGEKVDVGGQLESNPNAAKRIFIEAELRRVVQFLMGLVVQVGLLRPTTGDRTV